VADRLGRKVNYGKLFSGLMVKKIRGNPSVLASHNVSEQVVATTEAKKLAS
jgi:hypothetical protein